MRPLRGPIGPLVACLAVAAIVVAWRRLDVVEVRGRSMAPMLLPGDRLLALRLRRAPRPGEVVLAPDPRDPSRELVKRVMAVDPAGVTLRGDNPAFSTDARVFGRIPARAVTWRVALRIWPMRRIGPLAPAPRLALIDPGAEPACVVPESLVTG